MRPGLAHAVARRSRSAGGRRRGGHDLTRAAAIAGSGSSRLVRGAQGAPPPEAHPPALSANPADVANELANSIREAHEASNKILPLGPLVGLHGGAKSDMAESENVGESTTVRDNLQKQGGKCARKRTPWPGALESDVSAWKSSSGPPTGPSCHCLHAWGGRAAGPNCAPARAARRPARLAQVRRRHPHHRRVRLAEGVPRRHTSEPVLPD